MATDFNALPGSASPAEREIENTGSSPSISQTDELTRGAGTLAAPASGTSPPSRVFPTGQMEAGKSGEGGGIAISNADFLAAVFRSVPEGASAAVCTKGGNPELGGWPALRADMASVACRDGNNNYVCCSSLLPDDDGNIKARKERFVACHFLLFDDLGSKIPLERLGSFKLSWLIGTSPGNFQGGIILDPPVTDGALAIRLHDAIIRAGICDPGASGPLSRWARLPVAINGKPKYADASGKAFQCRLVDWRPENRYTPQQVVDGLGLQLATETIPKAATPMRIPAAGNMADEVFTPKAAENPVIAMLKMRGLYKTPLGSGKHDVTCPWFQEHTDRLDTGAAYFEPDEVYPIGGYCCQHSHRDKYHISELLQFLGVPSAAARNMPVIRVVAGDLDRVVSAAEMELAARGRHYQYGGLIVSISTDPATGDPSIVPVSAPALARELSVTATWEKYDKRTGNWERADPPTRHVAILFDAQHYRHLPPLAGVARQPYFREGDGVLVTQPGYDSGSKRFGVFDPKQFPMGGTTIEAAKAALTMIQELLREFKFVGPVDEAAALAAIFTAVVRPSLPVAPAFHVRASVFGSGKSYLCEVISAFAGPGLSEKVSYPATSEEATKVILALLLKNPACVEFDDMDSDWVPHGVIKRMLTSEKVSERILGVSKTATVSTRTLFLGSGNNVGPIRDMLRRVATIHLDPRVENPATLTYIGDPVTTVKKSRGRYVMAVMTIIEAWKQAGMPRTTDENIVTYDGDWSDYCRHPLIWLGFPDPAKSLLEQVRHDPDADALKGLLTAWHKAFGAIPTTVRKAVAEAAQSHSDLFDAMREFPVEERGEINRSKLGWLLKKNANRIVGGFEFQKAEADGRTAWRVVSINPPHYPHAATESVIAARY